MWVNDRAADNQNLLAALQRQDQKIEALEARLTEGAR
jgi:hypothetical protein